jgi:hypothetical protein
MSNHNNTGFTKRYHSMEDHPVWQSASPKHQIIFYHWLRYAAYEDTIRYFYKKPYKLKKGQHLFTERGLAKELSQHKKRKEHKFNKSDVSRAIEYFSDIFWIASEVRHDVRHDPMVITILYSEFCDHVLEQTAPPSVARLRHDCATFLDILDIKDKKKKERKPRTVALVDNADALRLCQLFLNSLLKKNPEMKVPKIEAWNREFEKMLRIDGRESTKIELAIQGLQGHWYAPNVNSAAKFRSKYDDIVRYLTEVKTEKKPGAMEDIFERLRRKSYTYDLHGNQIEIRSSSGSMIGKFSLSDAKGIDLWLKDRNG